ncbi:MAG: 2-C-methyl-D-erythritol 4-phosphate cytidylyltransferase [Alphaproteobacteria bacterium]
MTAAPRLPPASDVSALVLAAGTGTRLGNRSKAFLAVGGVTLVERVVARMRPYCAEILVGLPPDEVETGRALFEGAGVTAVAGGATRQETVEILLARAGLPLVLVHDVARPLARPDLFERVLAAGALHGAAVAALPAGTRDSLGLAENGELVSALAREAVVFTQTPQAFRREILLEACRKAREQGCEDPSLAGLMVRTGRRVRLVEGDPENVKITFAEDWEQARRTIAAEGAHD